MQTGGGIGRCLNDPSALVGTGQNQLPEQPVCLRG